MKLNVDQEYDWTNDDVFHRQRYSATGKKLSNRSFADFTLKASVTALISTFIIMFIFSAVGEQTDSPLVEISELVVLGLWFVPDIISIPFVGAAAALGVFVELMKPQFAHALRHAFALCLCLLNGYIVYHHLLDRFAFLWGVSIF